MAPSVVAYTTVRRPGSAVQRPSFRRDCRCAVARRRLAIIAPLDERESVASPSDTPERFEHVRLLQQAWILNASAVGFSLLALDVFNPNSLHLLLQVDQGAAGWVAEHLSEHQIRFVGDQLMSNTPICMGIGGWLACAAVILRAERASSWSTLLPAGAFYVFGGGGITNGDTTLVHALKEFFHRVRPDVLHHCNFSFPSGHTTEAVFVWGALVTVLAPIAYTHLVPPAAAKPAADATRSAIPWYWPLLLWAAAGSVTATGRVLGQAHWVSDTFAGACLGVGLTSLLAISTSALRRQTASR